MRNIISGVLAVLFSAAVCHAGPKRQPKHFTFSPGSIRGDIKLFRMPLPDPIIQEVEEAPPDGLPPRHPKTPKTPKNIQSGYSQRVREWANYYPSQIQNLHYQIEQGNDWLMHSVCFVMDKRAQKEGWYDAMMSYEETTLVILQELAAVAQFNQMKISGGSLKINPAIDQANEYCHITFEARDRETYP